MQPLSVSPEEVEARERERREQLLRREYMPAFRTPRPVEYDRFWSAREGRTNSPYALPTKHSHESSYLTSYKPIHVQDMYHNLAATHSAGRLLATRSQFVQSEPKQQAEAPSNSAPSRLRARLEAFELEQLRTRAERLPLDLGEVESVISSSTDPKLELIELIIANSSLDDGSRGAEDKESHLVDTSATFRGLMYLPTPPKTTTAQFFKRRNSHISPSSRSRHGQITDEFSNRTMSTRWQFAAEAREPLLSRLGHPFDKSFMVMVHREHCTAFVEVATGMTPRQLINRMRNEPPPGKPFDRLRAGQFLAKPCFARLVRGPFVLAEDKPLSAQSVGSNCKLALVYKEKQGTFDLIDPELAAKERAEAESKTKHFSRREEHLWGWIGQPDPQVLAQSWFQKLLEAQTLASGHNVQLRSALGLAILHQTQSAAIAPPKKKKKKGTGGKKKKGKKKK
eukprot:COSAG02_NODE_9_length_59728_cov_36.104714_54_plen_453_part_00